MQLAIYAYDSCPYCQNVYRAIADLKLDVEKRDVLLEPTHREALREAVGRGTVPVLRIEQDGEVRWMPESRDIIAWLYETYGDGKKPSRFGALFHQYATFAMWGLLAAGMFYPEHQSPLWIVALSIGAIRSIRNTILARSWTHGLIALMFVFGVAAVSLRWAGVASIPWWYGAYALVGVLFLAALIGRFALSRRQGRTSSLDS